MSMMNDNTVCVEYSSPHSSDKFWEKLIPRKDLRWERSHKIIKAHAHCFASVVFMGWLDAVFYSLYIFWATPGGQNINKTTVQQNEYRLWSIILRKEAEKDSVFKWKGQEGISGKVIFKKMGWSQQHGDARKNVLLGTQKEQRPWDGEGAQRVLGNDQTQWARREREGCESGEVARTLKTT